MPQTILNATIPTDGTNFPLSELLLTLAYLRGLYVDSVEHLYAALGTAEPPLTEEMLVSRALEQAQDLARPDSVTWLVEHGSKAFLSSDDELLTSDIRRANPIEIALVGLAVPLTLAVVLSGGKLTLGPLKVELPPLGKGIEVLRNSLRPLKPAAIERLKAKPRLRPRLRTE